MDVNKTGEFLAALRKSQGYTQQEVGDYLNISNKTISKWEQGKGYPDLTVLPMLAEFYQVSVDEILAGEKMKRQTEQDCRRGAAFRRYLSGRIHLRFDLCMVAVLVSVLIARVFSYKSWCMLFNILAGGILLTGLLMTNYTLNSAEGTLEKVEREKLFRAAGQKTFLAICLIMWSAMVPPFLIYEHSFAALLSSQAWTIVCTVLMAVLWVREQKHWGSFFDKASGIFCGAGLVIMNVSAAVFGYLWEALCYYTGVLEYPKDMIPAHRIVLLIHFLGLTLIAAGVIMQLAKDRRK